MTAGRLALNDYGTVVSLFTCQDCGDEFTVCPAVPDWNADQWTGCQAVTCASYDPARDIDALWDQMQEHGLIRRRSTS